jgi:uncharacterized membrane protein
MIFDATKSFNVAYLLAGAMAIVALIIAFTVKMPQEQQSF